MKRKTLFVHQGSELYGSDFIFSTVVRHASKITKPIIVLDSSGPLVEKLTPHAEAIYIIPLGVLRRKYLNPVGIFVMAWVMLGAILKLIKIIRKHDVSLVYTNTIGVLSGAFAAYMMRKPHIMHIHEILEEPRFIAALLAKFATKLSTRVVAVSGPVADYLRTHSSNNALNVCVIHNGISTDRFDIAIRGNIRAEFACNDNVFLVGMVGRLHFWKGQDILIEAAKILVDRGCNKFKVLMFGDVFSGYEAYGAELKKRVREYGLQETVIFCGFRNDAASLFVDADVIVVPSTLPDPLPTVVLEGMAARKPVVSTRHGGALEMIEDGRTGFLINPKSAVELAEKLEELMNYPELRFNMGAAGRERLEKCFSEQRFEKDILALINSELD